MLNLTDNEIKMLIQNGIIPPDTPPLQIQYFLKICEAKNLNPFNKQYIW